MPPRQAPQSPRFPSPFLTRTRAFKIPRPAALAPVRFPFSRARDCRIAPLPPPPPRGPSCASSRSAPPPAPINRAPGAHRSPHPATITHSSSLALFWPDFAIPRRRPRGLSSPIPARPSTLRPPRLHHRHRLVTTKLVRTFICPEDRRNLYFVDNRTSPPPLTSPPANSSCPCTAWVSTALPIASSRCWYHPLPLPRRQTPASPRPSHRRLCACVAR